MLYCNVTVMLSYVVHNSSGNVIPEHVHQTLE